MKKKTKSSAHHPKRVATPSRNEGLRKADPKQPELDMGNQGTTWALPKKVRK